MSRCHLLEAGTAADFAVTPVRAHESERTGTDSFFRPWIRTLDARLSRLRSTLLALMSCEHCSAGVRTMTWTCAADTSSDAAELTAISRAFRRCNRSGRARSPPRSHWHSLREVPYLVHTNYELPLLLEGRKQLPRTCASVIRRIAITESEYFDRYVREGLLYKEVSFEPFNSPEQLSDGSVIEATAGPLIIPARARNGASQAWKLISAASRKSGWNDETSSAWRACFMDMRSGRWNGGIGHLRERKALVRNKASHSLDVSQREDPVNAVC